MESSSSNMSAGIRMDMATWAFRDECGGHRSRLELRMWGSRGDGPDPSEVTPRHTPCAVSVCCETVLS